jgi:hypothetical protein
MKRGVAQPSMWRGNVENHNGDAAKIAHQW